MTKYNDEIVNELIKYIKAGNYIKTACEAVGIDESTFYKWGKRAEKKEEPYFQFFQSIKRAESEAIIRNVITIQNAAKRNWTAAAWFLERKDYERWGRKELVGGIPDKPIQIDLSGLSTEEIRALAYEHKLKDKSTAKKSNKKSGKAGAGKA
jgi:hypothetical protein